MDLQGNKAELPDELRQAMKLDPDQFEELEMNALQGFMQFAMTLSGLDALPTEPSEMEVAFRPTRNPDGQYFAVGFSVMVDPQTNGARLEVVWFKPLVRSAYIQYCIDEHGGPPSLVDPTLN